MPCRRDCPVMHIHIILLRRHCCTYGSLICDGRDQRAPYRSHCHYSSLPSHTHKGISAAQQPKPPDAAALPPLEPSLQTKSCPTPPGLSRRFNSALVCFIHQ